MDNIYTVVSVLLLCMTARDIAKMIIKHIQRFENKGHYQK